MIGRVISTIICIAFFTFTILMISTFFLHQNIMENVNEINYITAEIVSTTGVFTTELKDYLMDNVNKFGVYNIKLKLERLVGENIYDIYFDEKDIVDKPLGIGDKLTIYLEDRNPTLFGRLINMCFMGYKPENFLDTHIKSIKTAFIAKDNSNLVKGYDVITDISNNSHINDIAIFVVTKLNPSGKYYGSSSHKSVEKTNLYYGDSSDEMSNTGKNYIFDNGDFEKAVEDLGSGIKVIKYIQK